MLTKTKILIGILVVGLIGAGVLLVLYIRGTIPPWKSGPPFLGRMIEIKAKLEMVEGISPLFNKECLNSDFKVGTYYLKGLCQKPYLAASLAGIVGEEIEVEGIAREVEVAVSSEENPEILITKTFEVIEVEEIIPPEIIIIATETNQYQPGEKITIHLKHYLKRSIFSYFGIENSTCAIETIEKKNEEWERITSWSQPADCPPITLKEIKPYYLSGEFNIFDWQPPTLGPGQYRLKIIYKLAGEDDWKETYSNEFIILKPEASKPETETGCKVDRGYSREAEEKFHKVVIFDVEWNNYKNFSVKEITIHYGYGPSPIFDEGALTQKLISQDGEIIKVFRVNDPREVTIMCEMGAHCLPSQFLEEGEQTIINSLAFYLVTSDDKEFVEAKDIKFIEWYEREKLPEWAFPEGKAFPDYKSGKLLLRINLSKCMKKFCREVALENDPSCVGEYYSPATAIKGKITDHQGNPVSNVQIDYYEKLGTKRCGGSSYTDENGNYIINECYPETNLREGLYFLDIYPPYWSNLNLKREYKEVNLKKGETKILNIALKQCGSISGKITDKQGNPITEAWVYEIGFETPRTHVCEMPAECELGTFVIPNLDPGDYKIGAFVKIGEKNIDLQSKEVKVELGKTSLVNFVLEQ